MFPLRRAVSVALLLPTLLKSQYTTYQTNGWQTYPGYSGNAYTITGTLEITAGPTASDLLLTGSLSGLPAGTGNGLHLHEGFDVAEAVTVGGHYFPGLAVDPWNAVNYTGPTYTMNSVVIGIPWKESLGRVVVIHDSTGTRVAIAKVVPKVAVGGMLYEASLATYPMYNSLVASITAASRSGTSTAGWVWLTESSGGYTVTYDLRGLPNDAGFGVAVHQGSGHHACDSDANVGGRYWSPSGANTADPWTGNITTYSSRGSAAGSYQVSGTGYPLAAFEYQAVVVRNQDGTRIGCGVLHSSAKATVGAYPGYTALNPAVSGLIWVAQGSTANADLVVGYKIDNLPAAETSGGLHIHQGKTCATAGNIGGHFWTPETSPDPWNANTKWTKASGLTTATGKFTVNSGYSLAENADHAVVVHAASGTKIGCGALQYYPTARGYVVLTGALTLTGNLGGTMFKTGASGGIHVHEGTSCAEAQGPNAPGGHLLNSDGSDPWSTTYTVGGQVGRPKGGVDYGATTHKSGEAPVSVSVTGDRQTLAVASGKTIVVHSENGGRIACGVVAQRAGPPVATNGASGVAPGLRALTALAVITASGLLAA